MHFRFLPILLKIVILQLLLIQAKQSLAQTTEVHGILLEEESNRPLPYANVFFLNTKIGAVTDTAGRFYISTSQPVDSLVCTAIGYQAIIVPIIRGIKQDKEIFLSVRKFSLPEVIIRPENLENPAYAIIRNVLKNKSKHNPERLDAFQYEAYNKIELDLDEVTEEVQKKTLFKALPLIKSFVDTSGETAVLPFFLTENLSDVYYRKKPRTKQEYVKASKVSGIDNESISSLMGDMYQQVNFYENRVLIFGKNFVSPISQQCFQYYEYQLVDSGWVDDVWCYHIQFEPRRKQELTFTGNMWITEVDYAIRLIKADIAEDANINYISHIYLEQWADLIGPETWMPTRENMDVHAKILIPHEARKQPFLAKRTTTYKDIVVNHPQPDSFYNWPKATIFAIDAKQKEPEYWNEVRHTPLTASEEAVYTLVDTIQQTTIFKLVRTLSLGYHRIGPIELGPFITIYSYNPIEGPRFRFGGRTSPKFSRRTQFSAYGAHGLTDQKWKYGIQGRHFLSKKRWEYIDISWKEDVEQLGRGLSNFRYDNIFSSLLRRTPANRLNFLQEGTFTYEREWKQGFSNKIQIAYRNLSPLGVLTYDRIGANGEIENIANIATTEFSLYTHFAPKETFLASDFNRVSLGTRYPIIDFLLAFGTKGLGGEYAYQKAVLSIIKKNQLGTFGYIRYRLEAGKIWGDLPWPLLELHPGNESFIFDTEAFNLMNFFEFVSDQYVSLSASHHFEGLVLNHIPLIRKLKWREVLGVKGVIGSFRPSNEDVLILPEYVNTLDKPYYELSAGIENILSILRVDAVWRRAYLDQPNVKPFGVRMSISVNF